MDERIDRRTNGPTETNRLTPIRQTTIELSKIEQDQQKQLYNLIRVLPK